MKYYLFLLINAIALSQSLQINEVVSSNSSIFYDEDGDTPDWIEIYNPKNSYKKINIRKKNVIKSRLRILYEWRELSAQKLNIPRNWIISDKTILQASKKDFKIEKLLKNKKNKNFDQKIESFKKFLLKKILP